MFQLTHTGNYYVGMKSEPCAGVSEKTSFISYTIQVSCCFKKTPKNPSLHLVEHKPKLIEVVMEKMSHF